MDRGKLLQDLGYGILFQLGEGPCTAGCEICYERPAAIRHLTSKGLISFGGDAPDNKHLAGIMAQHPELGLQMPVPQIHETFRLLKEAGIGRVSLAGSEPTDHPQFRQILDAAHEEGLQVRIYTSGLHHKKMFHPALRVIVLHLDYRQCGVEKGLRLVREGQYPDSALMESVKALIDSGVEIQLRINFESHTPLKTPEWVMLANFYSQLTPDQRKKAMLKYSFTVRVHGEESLWHATPEGMKANSEAITQFVNDFRRTYGAPMLSERTLFRCAFPDEVWKEYSRTGGFRSMCNMELTYYWQNGQTILGFCPPARTLVQPRHVTNVDEFWQALSQFHQLFDLHNRTPAFPVCTACELRGLHPNDEVVCQGGCLGGKATALVQLGIQQS